MSLITVVVVPSFSIVWIVNETSAPLISPSSSNFCKDGKPKVTLTASTFVSVIDLLTGVFFVTTTPTAVSDSLAVIPSIAVWSDVPNLGWKVIFWKLKSSSLGFVLLADCCNTCTPLRNTSFRLPVLYSVDPWLPVALGKPSIIPSPNNSTNVWNCFEAKTSFGKFGSCNATASCIVLKSNINLYPLLELYQYQN